jgi:hypothetical protein
MITNGALGGRWMVSPIVMRVFVLCAVVLGLLLAMSVSVARASFGIEPGSLGFAFDNSEGILETQAGSHPYEFQLHFKLSFDEGTGRTEDGEMRDAITDLPPGMVGNLTAVPACPRQSFEGVLPDCPPSTQIGVLRVILPGLKTEVFGPIYNLVPSPGVVSQFGFSNTEFTAFFTSTVRTEEGYRVRVEVPDAPLEVSSVQATVWGTPAAASHDAEREGTLPPGSTLTPFLTSPTSCVSPPGVTVAVDSRLNPGAFVAESALLRDLGGNPQALSGCESVPFTPTVLAAPTTTASESPSGLGFQLKLPNQGLLDPNEGAVSETEPETMEVQLPAGITANPAAANGLQGCTEAQIGYKQTQAGEPVFNEQQPACPEASKLGTLSGSTPLLEEPLEGEVYLASPDQNPFGSLLALYIVARIPHRGVLIKLAAEARIDHTTGQITTTIKGMPPLPYSLVELHLHGGSRAPLITPQACGEYHTTARLRSFAQPEETIERSSPFTISSGANGGSCASSEAQLPNSPSLQAGTLTPLAGAFSPFVFNMSREDGTQRLGAITATLPEGLLGKLAGVSYCSDAQIAAATARSNEGEGATEQSSPSCPESSQVGVVNITAGAGSQPYAVQGKAYLAGPYKNAPLSLAVITPAVAGPFDLGTVVVRVALYIDQNTAQIHAVSDPIPTILDGIPLDVRSVSLSMNRTGFTLNPTSCEPMTVNGEAISTLNQTIGLSNRFQVGGCQGLPFKPAMAISTQGRTSKANGASLTVKVSQKPGEANIHKVDLTLPTALPARLTTLQQACTEAQFNTNPAGCPPGSFIGTAKALTPILSTPLIGPAILVSHGGAAFPDVVFLLQANERGSGIRIDLDGKTDIKKGITYSRFETVPDAPIASFETNLPQGPHSVLSANGNLCTSKLAIPTELTGQNGAQISQSTKVTVTGCPKTKTLTRAQKLKLALKTCKKKPKGKKRANCERAARKKYAPVMRSKKTKKK